jgi:AcrR family transcriptional regulator
MTASYEAPRLGAGGKVLVLGSRTDVVAAGTPRPTRRGGKTQKGELSRRRVLEAAVLVLARKGYAETSVRDIASAANTLTAALYYHFSRKDGLIVGVVDHCVGVIQEHLRRRSHAELLPEDRVSEIVQALLALSKECRAELRVLTDLASRAPEDEVVRAAVAQGFQALASEFAILLSGGESRGRTTEVTLRTASHLILATLQGLLVLDEYVTHSLLDEAQSHRRALESTVRCLIG